MLPTNTGACLGRTQSVRFVGGLLRSRAHLGGCCAAALNVKFRPALHLNASGIGEPLQFVLHVHFALNPPFTHSLLAQARCLSCKTARANRFLSRLKSRLYATTASRETNLRTALIGSTRCRVGYPRKKWKSFARSLPTTRPCCYASRWASAPIRRKRPFKAALLTRFLNGRASQFQWTLWRSTAAATLDTL